MLGSQRSTREVKESFLLADAMKAGPFEMPYFQQVIVAERLRVASLSSDVIENLVKDSKTSSTVERCHVASLGGLAKRMRRLTGMGGREWARGLVPQVCKKVRPREVTGDRLFAMSRLVPLFYS
jgi:hypothetical protein